MDLALKPDDEAFAASFREWLETHLQRPPAFVDLAQEVEWGRQWQATLAVDHWVGVHWPTEYGGKGLTLLQQLIWYEEYAARGFPGIDACFVGNSHAGPTLITRATDAISHRSCRPRRSGASSSASLTPGATWPH